MAQLRFLDIKLRRDLSFVEAAGVAKGTFYLYFRDKYDIRNKLIAHKATHIFSAAIREKEKKSKKFPFIIFLELEYWPLVIFVI